MTYYTVEDVIEMKRDIEAIEKIALRQERVLVAVIQFLDANGHSDTDVRRRVDILLNKGEWAQEEV